MRGFTTYAIPTPDNPDRGFVALLTVANPTAAAKAVTVTIDASTPAGFPKYFEAADYAAGSFTCVTGTNGSYYKASTTTAMFTCTGTLAANAVSVITLSSGSMIAATAAGQPVTVVATANPGGSTKTLQGTFA